MLRHAASGDGEGHNEALWSCEAVKRWRVNR
jgi:hypothetical protein